MRLRERIAGRIARPEGKRLYVRDLFGRIAGRYDLTNDVMSLGLHRRWKRQALELAEIRPGDVVLDLAAGTGDLALRAARGPTEPGCVIAADLTPGMVWHGRRRPGAERVSWLLGDAMSLPLAEASVDRVVIGYGLRNFPHLRGALAEILRCLRPGGRLAALDFGRPEAPLLEALYLRYLDVSTAAAGWLLHRDVEAYVYIPESLRRYPAQEGVLELMQRTGYVRCGYVDLLFGTMAISFGERPEATTGSSTPAPASRG